MDEVASDEPLRRENIKLAKQIGILLEKIALLEQENLRLKAMLDKNSGNSSKPPSSNGFKNIQKYTQNEFYCSSSRDEVEM
jgi:cell shape-determining protein MreC